VALCTEISVERHKPLICTGHGCGGGRRKGAGVAIAGAVHSGGAGHAGVEVRAGWSGLGGQGWVVSLTRSLGARIARM